MLDKVSNEPSLTVGLLPRSSPSRRWSSGRVSKGSVRSRANSIRVSPPLRSGYCPDRRRRDGGVARALARAPYRAASSIQTEPSLTVPPQRRCAAGDPGVGLLPLVASVTAPSGFLRSL